MCVCVYKFLCKFVYVYVYMYTSTYIYIYICVYTHVCTYMYTYMYIYIYIQSTHSNGLCPTQKRNVGNKMLGSLEGQVASMLRLRVPE